MWEIIKKPRILRGYPEKEGEEGIAVKERFVYDAQNRLLQHYHQVDNNTEELLAENNYNELSQLANKKVGNHLQSIDYTYNIRGWMTHINKDQMALDNLEGKLFSYKIKYNQKDGIESQLYPVSWKRCKSKIQRKHCRSRLESCGGDRTKSIHNA